MTLWSRLFPRDERRYYLRQKLRQCNTRDGITVVCEAGASYLPLPIAFGVKMMIDEREVTRRAKARVPPPTRSFEYGPYEMTLERVKEEVRREMRAEQDRARRWL